MRKRSQTREVNEARLSQPNARQAAMLVVHLMNTRQKEITREITRARLSELALRNLWIRSQIPPKLLRRVQEILIHAGWVLFWAGSSYAIIKVSAVEGWPLIASKRISDDLKKVSRGSYDFDQLEELLLPEDEFEAFAKEE